MKKTILLIILFGTFSILYGQSLTHNTYQEDNSNFPNPERGFYHQVSSFNYDDFVSYRKEGITLVLRNYNLGPFKNGPISVSFLRDLEHDFAMLRKAGVKAVVRFKYTDKDTAPYGDARAEIVLMHVQQLKPILTANSDVILVLQAGFIGAWGEWYYTDYYSQSPGVVSEQNWMDRRQLVDSLLTAIPTDRMVQVRTPYYKKNLLNLGSFTPVTQEQAYTDLPIARIAHHNDCFVAGPSDYGTYRDSTIEKPYLAKDSKYTIVGGETCNKCAQSTCSNAVKEMRRFHWTFLNIDYNQSVLGEWKDQGCFPETQRKLGYRFRMLNTDIQSSSKPGGVFGLKIKMVNDGWANPTNPRPVEIILKNKTNGKIYYVNPAGDMRFWPIHDTINMSIDAGLPENVEPGDYDAFINFPDADSRLNERPEYSIRLANTNVWDSVSGFNSLNQTVRIDTSVQVATYYGDNYFKEKNSVSSGQTHIIIDGNADEWSNLPVVYSANSQRANILKIFNTKDTLFILVKGNGLYPHSQFLFDTDSDSLTGIFYGPWAHTGFDYLVENYKLYQYNGTANNWSFKYISDVTFSQNKNVIELKIPFSQINSPSIVDGFHMGFINNFDSTDDKSYLPLAQENLMYYKINSVSGSPGAIVCKNYGTNNLVYWTRNLQNKNIYTVLQKAGSGGKFEDLSILQNGRIYYVDNDLQTGDKVSYRVQYKEGNDLSPFSDSIEKTVLSNQNHFIDIHLDGQSNDWNLCPPSATGLLHDSMASISFFNQAAATDSLFFDLEAKMEQSYRLNIDVNGDGIFDWYISNDSLFSNLGGKDQFIKTLRSFRNTDFLESGLKMSEIGLDTVNTFNATLFIDGQDVWGNGEHFSFMKYQQPSVPKYFKLSTLTNYTYSRIKLTWYPNQTPDGYIIERSVGDSLHFEQLVSLDKSKFQYIDKNLDSTFTYYYRIFSYKDILRSAYTVVKGMRPGRPLGFNSLKAHTASVTVIPNPMKQYGQIEISLDNSDVIQIYLYSLNGQKVKTFSPEKIAGRTTIPLNVSKLKSGYYLLKIVGEKTLLFKKIIIY